MTRNRSFQQQVKENLEKKFIYKKSAYNKKEHNRENNNENKHQLTTRRNTTTEKITMKINISLQQEGTQQLTGKITAMTTNSCLQR